MTHGFGIAFPTPNNADSGGLIIGVKISTSNIPRLLMVKVDYGVLSKGAYLLSWGANVGSETGPVLGGYAGGPEGTALVNAAYSILGTVIQKASYQLSFPIHYRFGCTTDRKIL